MTINVGLGLSLVDCAPAVKPEDVLEGSGASSGTGSGGSGGLGNSETGGGPGGPPTSTGAGSSTGSTGAVGTDGTGEATEAGTSTGCWFICETTGNHNPDQCDNFAQNCPEGQKCAAWAEGGGSSWNALKCVPVMGDKQPGEPCVAPEGPTGGLDNCAEGVMCWNVDETNMGICVALCSGSAEAPVCPDGGTCTIASGGELNLCLVDCDPLVQDCPGSDLCIPNVDRFVCVLDASGEEGQLNDGCEFANACDKGLICLNTVEASSACDPEANGCCQPFCEFPGGGCPNVDQACVQWYDPMDFPPDSPKLKYGVCKVAG